MKRRRGFSPSLKYVIWGFLIATMVLVGLFTRINYLAKTNPLNKQEAAQFLKEKKADKTTTNTKEKATTNASATTTSQKPKPDDIPGKRDDWALLLVNRDHPIKDEPTDIGEFQGYPIDNKIVPALKAMTEAAEKDGIKLLLVSAYRSVSYQEELFQESITEGLDKGLSEEKAKEEALKYRTEPGTSEHHTGLACDIIDEAWNDKSGDLIDSYGKEPGGKWLAEHGADYGFVVRYPENKEKETYIEYEPWHMRYVGVENAKYMKDHQLCLEEYVALLKG